MSHDGKWIYFSSTRTGRSEVGRLPAEGEAVQMTHEGGLIPFEPPDGKVVNYQKILGDSDVWKVPVAGGEETRVFGSAGGLSSRLWRTGSTSLNLVLPDTQVGLQGTH